MNQTALPTPVSVPVSMTIGIKHWVVTSPGRWKLHIRNVGNTCNIYTVSSPRNRSYISVVLVNQPKPIPNRSHCLEKSLCFSIVRDDLYHILGLSALRCNSCYSCLMFGTTPRSLPEGCHPIRKIQISLRYTSFMLLCRYSKLLLKNTNKVIVWLFSAVSFLTVRQILSGDKLPQLRIRVSTFQKPVLSSSSGNEPS